jgi:hypothetical protein
MPRVEFFICVFTGRILSVDVIQGTLRRRTTDMKLRMQAMVSDRFQAG